jgi:hypothetical protein
MEAIAHTMNPLPPKVKNLKGNVFGRLTIQEFVRLSHDGALWKCACACGNETTVKAGDLKSGNTKSCGCQRSEVIRKANLKHGITCGLKHNEYPKTYKIWRSIVNRCCTSSSSSFHDYGGRGITVCEAWRSSYEAFIGDMGECPAGYSIERIDVNGNYEPNNCTWIPLQDQVKNRRNTVLVLLDGKEMLQAEAARELGVNPSTIFYWRKGKQKKPSHIDLVFLQTITQ